MKRRPELSTKVELARRAPPPVACYLIVLLARHDAPSWSRFLLSPPFYTPSHPTPRLLAPLYGLSSCFVIGISLPLYLSSNISLHRAPDPLLSPFPVLQLVLFSLGARRTAELACKSSTRSDHREISSPPPPFSSSKYCGILSERCFVATATSARRYKAVVFL